MGSSGNNEKYWMDGSRGCLFLDPVAVLFPVYPDPQLLLTWASHSWFEAWLCSLESWSPCSPVSVSPVLWVGSSCMHTALLISLDGCGLSWLPSPCSLPLALIKVSLSLHLRAGRVEGMGSLVLEGLRLALKLVTSRPPSHRDSA